jgi:lipopolysaccharide transport system permease protein
MTTIPNQAGLAGRPVAPDAPASRPAPQQPSTWICPPGPMPALDVRELWRFRELGLILAGRDVKVRYKQTALGAAWAVLQPAMMMVVFTLFFGRMAGLSSGDVPYPLFAYAGLLPWTFFSTAIAAAGSSVVGSERLITKVYFPRLAIPFAAVGAAVVDFVIAFGLLLAMMAYYGIRPGPGLLLMPPVFALLALAALGVGTLFAALNVAYRDVRYVLPFLIQVWLFATPAVYMQSAGAAGGAGRFARLLAMNPLNALIEAFRAAVLGGAIPWDGLAVAVPVVAAVFLVGCLYFSHLEGRFADII